ncbi:MAG: acyl-CoA thioesterase [Burkholderiaceae bacterium]
MSDERESPHGRAGYRHFHSISTRWMDNDAYGHVNNVVYLSWFDTVVNEYLIHTQVLDPRQGSVVGFVVETQCRYISPLAFPQQVDAGLRVRRIGTSSVRYEIAIFAEHAETASAQGYFVHVYVDRAARKPVPVSEQLLAALRRIEA